MMRHLLLILLVLGWSGQALRSEPLGLHKKKCSLNWCPDDYCKKPLPPTYCVPPGCKDDYCRKPLPPVYCVPPGCKDDYCKKPLPACPAVGSGWWYICGPGDGCCKTHHSR